MPFARIGKDKRDARRISHYQVRELNYVVIEEQKEKFMQFIFIAQLLFQLNCTFILLYVLIGFFFRCEQILLKVSNYR